MDGTWLVEALLTPRSKPDSALGQVLLGTQTIP
jgi:hypothetical protein